MLIGAAILLDLLWPIFLLLGWESAQVDPRPSNPFLSFAFVHYPISHSLVTAIGWGALAAVAYWALTRKTTGAVWTGILVVSHWILDFVTHRPDLPLAPGGELHVGLGLWRSVPATLAVEGAMFAAGIWIYAKATRARDRVGRWGFVSFVVFLLAIYAASASSPAPASLTAIAWVTLSSAILPVWAAWFDRHRE